MPPFNIIVWGEPLNSVLQDLVSNSKETRNTFYHMVQSTFQYIESVYALLVSVADKQTDEQTDRQRDTVCHSKCCASLLCAAKN